jgi:hypothetical protein
MIGFIADAWYTGCIAVWHLCLLSPHPSWGELLKSVEVFIVLYPVRLIMKALMPEDTVARRYRRRKHTAPTAAEHQGATAIASELFHH